MGEALIKAKVYTGANEDGGPLVYSNQIYHAGDILEECPIVPCYRFEHQLSKHLLTWDNYWCLPLGMGALYPRSTQGSCQWFPDYSRQVLVIMAKQTIRPGELILLDYERSSAAAHRAHQSHNRLFGPQSSLVLAIGMAVLAFVVLNWFLL